MQSEERTSRKRSRAFLSRSTDCVFPVQTGLKQRIRLFLDLEIKGLRINKLCDVGVIGAG
jgi:hypothetical protein